MPTIKVEFQVEVKAKAEKLWDILADVKSWPERQVTSYIKPITIGPIKEGSAFVAEFGGLKWNLIVTKAERPNRLSWTGQRLGLKALHEWEFLEEGGKTEAVTRETVSGWLLFLLYPVVRRQLPGTNEKYLAKLKNLAETL